MTNITYVQHMAIQDQIKRQEEAKKNYSNDPHELSAKLKDISKKVHTFNVIRYKGAQTIASAALKIYKRSLSVLGKVVKQQKNI